MRRSVFAIALVLALAAPFAVRGYAQTATNPPQGDEFNASTFQAPFHVVCAAQATQPCPDNAGPGTWNLNSESPGHLRIYTQYGSLFGTTAQSSNSARNLVLQNISPSGDWTITTYLAFQGGGPSFSPVGQTAGLIAYQNDDNFIFVGRVLTATGPQLQFAQEAAGVDTFATPVVEVAPYNSSTVYLRLVKTGSVYTGFYSYDNTTWTQFVIPTPTPTVVPTNTPTGPTDTPTSTPLTTATSTVVPTSTAVPTSPAAFAAPLSPLQVGPVAWGGTNLLNLQNVVAADFDWFRVGNSQTPAPTLTPTSTVVSTSTATSTATVGPTNTAVPTGVPTATNTPVPTATNTPIPTATSTPTATAIPSPTTKPRRPYVLTFSKLYVWWPVVREGTHEHIVVQANHRQTLGIWVHAIFPNGYHVDFYQNTDGSGHWEADFNVPRGVITPNWNQGIVTAQLWHSHTTVKNFVFFTLVH